MRRKGFVNHAGPNACHFIRGGDVRADTTRTDAHSPKSTVPRQAPGPGNNKSDNHHPPSTAGHRNENFVSGERNFPARNSFNSKTPWSRDADAF